MAALSPQRTVLVFPQLLLAALLRAVNVLGLVLRVGSDSRCVIGVSVAAKVEGKE